MTRVPTNVGGQQPFDAGDATQGPFRPVSSYPGKKSVGLFQVAKGSLIRFQYTLWKHDPYPLLIVTDRLPDGDVRGVNLRYLTLNYVVFLIQHYCGKPVSYGNLRANDLFVRSFRRFKSFGMRNIEMLDCDLILKTIDIIRTYDPNQEQAMREAVQKQLQRQVNPTAEDLSMAAQQPVSPVSPTPPTPTPEVQRQFGFMQEGGGPE